jgi:hypothetical protein
MERNGIAIDHVLPVQSIPKTTSGKLQRFKLCEELLEGKYDDVREKLDEMMAAAEKAGGHGLRRVSPARRAT